VGDHGQKVWTSLAHWSHWCFVLCRTEPDAPSHQALSVPARADAAARRRRPADRADHRHVRVQRGLLRRRRTAAANVVGERRRLEGRDGTLAFERGASTLGQQIAFANELDESSRSPSERQGERPVMRQRSPTRGSAPRHALQRAPDASTRRRATLSREAMITSSTGRPGTGISASSPMDVLGAAARSRRPRRTSSSRLQRMFLFTRADTIYAGSNQIQRNIIASARSGCRASRVAARSARA
jgi:alkylation response protein AidB-like acyl-CoA dehydrogenase